ncbi:MAG: hypothetical protein EOO65_02590 [Methanosarcinales archaeon]|nr:MAG: hypothetical protein EOO65_02590 [Methanosarcinales archaeon]
MAPLVASLAPPAAGVATWLTTRALRHWSFLDTCAILRSHSVPTAVYFRGMTDEGSLLERMCLHAAPTLLSMSAYPGRLPRCIEDAQGALLIDYVARQSNADDACLGKRCLHLEYHTWK